MAVGEMRKLWVICFAVAGFGSSQAWAINTHKSWDGRSYVEPLGCPGATTFGEVITIPSGKTHLGKFHFWWINYNTGSMVVRGEVYAWDGSKATGRALYESKPRTISFSDGLSHNVAFKASLVPVTPGAQYVIFASIDKDYEQCTNGYVVGLGYIRSDVYSGGMFVFQRNGGVERRWTHRTWKTNPYPGDLAFTATLTL
jgi:hypothetical protein